jgi:alpha-L-rhamnosidase
VAPLLKEGKNTLALWYAAGWTRNNFFAPRVGQGFLLQMSGQTSSGSKIELHSDTSWRCAESYSAYAGHFSFMDMGGETVDGRRYVADWNQPGFDDSGWTQAKVAQPLKHDGELVLSAQMTDPSFIIDEFTARSLTDTIPGLWRADMGKTFTGYLEARFNGLKAGDTVLIQVSARPQFMEEHRQRHYYIARGEDGETFRNRFNFFAGRYIQFTGLRNAPRRGDIKGLAVSSAGKRTGYFECSDSLFNRIYEVDRRTYEMCNPEGVTVDCPDRERLGYGPEGGYQTCWGV